MSTFDEVKEKYEELREAERKSLAGKLAKSVDKRLRVISGGRAGKGLTKYTSGGRIPSYDLSNWKWVELTDDSDFNCIISLNMKETDFNSGNTHFLYDRIGIYIEYKKEETLYQTQIYPDINLPLNDDQIAQIARFVNEQYALSDPKAEEKCKP